MKRFNDLDEIYAGGLVPNGELTACSVCGKTFKRAKAAKTHFDKMACHTYQDVFLGTVTEEFLYDIYKELMNVYNMPIYGIGQFRRSRHYKPIAKFYLFCYHHGIREPFDYLEFAFLASKWNSIAQALAYATKESTLREYRKHRRLKPNMELSEKFFHQNRGEIESDPSFALRALERGDLALNYFIGVVDYDAFLDRCTDAELYRLERFLESVT